MPNTSQPPSVDRNELQAVKDALNADITDAGVGVVHVPTNGIYLCPVSQTTPPGHDALVRKMQLAQDECRGFVIAKTTAGQFAVENVSGLNVGSGGPTSLEMPVGVFDSIRQALMAAGL